jgi:hypothetical protein
MKHLKQTKAVLSYKSEVWTTTENNRRIEIAEILFMRYTLRLKK